MKFPMMHFLCITVKANADVAHAAANVVSFSVAKANYIVLSRSFRRNNEPTTKH